MTIFELGPFRPRMMSWKFGDDIRNGLGVIVLTNKQPDKQTNKQTKSQTDNAENNTTIVAQIVNITF